MNPPRANKPKPPKKQKRPQKKRPAKKTEEKGEWVRFKNYVETELTGNTLKSK